MRNMIKNTALNILLLSILIFLTTQLKGQTTNYATVELWTNNKIKGFNHFTIVYEDGTHEFVDFKKVEEINYKEIEKTIESLLRFQILKTQVINKLSAKGYELVIYSRGKHNEIEMIFKKVLENKVE